MHFVSYLQLFPAGEKFSYDPHARMNLSNTSYRKEEKSVEKRQLYTCECSQFGKEREFFFASSSQFLFLAALTVYIKQDKIPIMIKNN